MSENMPGEEVSDITTLSQLASDTSNGPAVASDIDASRRTGLKPRAEQRQIVSKPQPGQRKAVARMVQDQESEQLRPSQTACTTTDTANFGVTSSADTVLVGRAVSLGLNEETANLSGISQGNVDRREAVALEDAAEGGEDRRQGGEEQQEEKEDHELPTEVQDTVLYCALNLHGPKHAGALRILHLSLPHPHPHTLTLTHPQAKVLEYAFQNVFAPGQRKIVGLYWSKASLQNHNFVSCFCTDFTQVLTAFAAHAVHPPSKVNCNIIGASFLDW